MASLVTSTYETFADKSGTTEHPYLFVSLMCPSSNFGIYKSLVTRDCVSGHKGLDKNYTAFYLSRLYLILFYFLVTQHFSRSYYYNKLMSK